MVRQQTKTALLHEFIFGKLGANTSALLVCKISVRLQNLIHAGIKREQRERARLFRRSIQALEGC